MLQAASAPATSQPSTTSWYGTSSSSYMAVASTGRQPRSNTAEELESPLQAGSEVEQLITKQIRSSPSIVALEGVFTEWGGSFTLAHTVAALSRFNKSKTSAARDSKLRQLLPHKWLQLLPQAGGRQCVSALCACYPLSKEQISVIWAPTWAAFMQHVQQGRG